MNKDTVLEVKNLTMRFGGLVAVDDLSFDVKEKEVVGIIGPNGAGKTTVFNCITQFYKDDDGEIWLKSKKLCSPLEKLSYDFKNDDHSIKTTLSKLKLERRELRKNKQSIDLNSFKESLNNEKKKRKDRRKKYKEEKKQLHNEMKLEIKRHKQDTKNSTQKNKKFVPTARKQTEDLEINLNIVSVTNVIKHGLVRTFQNIELVKDLSIIDNVLIGTHQGFKQNFVKNLFNTKKNKQEEQELREKATSILAEFKIDSIKDQLVFGQPYGVLKKVEIARTLMLSPKIIILDEPAAGLNDLETKELAEIINKIKNDFNCSIVLIEHDMGFVMDICDRICAINFGKFLAMDTPKNIQQNPLVQEAYLGGDDDE